MLRRTIIAAAAAAAMAGANPAIGQGVGLYASFQQSGQTYLDASSTSAAAQISPLAPVAWVCNEGPAKAYAALGSLGVAATPSTAYPLPAGSCASLNAIGATYLAAITDSGSAHLSISTGTGWPAGQSAAGSASPAPSATAEGTHLFKATGGVAYAIRAVNQTATPGFLLLIDAAAVPADGAVTPVDCRPLPASGEVEIAAPPGAPAQAFANGIVAVASSGANCFTKTTGTITAFFRGLVR